MYLDKENLFSCNQAVLASGASADVVDLGPGDTGPSERVSLFVTAKDYDAGSMEVEVLTADEVDASGALLAPRKAAAYPVDAAALHAGGKVVSARLPHGMGRYMRLNYVLDGAPSAGSLSAGLVWDAQANGYAPSVNH